MPRPSRATALVPGSEIVPPELELELLLVPPPLLELLELLELNGRSFDSRLPICVPAAFMKFTLRCGAIVAASNDPARSIVKSMSLVAVSSGEYAKQRASAGLAFGLQPFAFSSLFDP